jgi:ribose 5-phosphate isomerase B
MKIGIASDHGGYELKEIIHPYLTSLGHEVIDFGAHELNNGDDYPDYVVPSIAANKVTGVRAALINDHFSAHQGVEDDDMNLLCLGGRVTGFMAAQELISAYLNANFTGAERHMRRLNKVKELER